MKKILLLSTMASAMWSGSHAQVAISDVTNDGSSVYDFSNAETVTTAPGSGVGYQSQNGGVFNHYGPAAATLTVNGAYDAYTATPGNPGVDNFTGLNNTGSAAEIAGTTAPTFGILNLNNGASTVSVTNAAGITIGSALAFSNGITSTIRSAANTGAIRLISGASYTNTALGSGQHVNGYVGKTGNTAFTYPVGDGSQARTLALTPGAGSTTATTLTIAYVAGDPGAAGNDPTGGAHNRASLSTAGTTGTTKLVSVSPLGFWDWVAGASTSGIPATFVLSLPAQTGNGSYATAAEIRAVGFNTVTGQWENLSGGSGASGTGAGSTITGTVTNMSIYSALGFGSVSAVPLPVGLLSFSGKAKGCAVVLSWSTATEQGSDYFAIERSADGKSWNEIRRVEAAGKSGATLSYQTTDESPLPGQNYYRLKLADLGGEIRYSNTAGVTPDCGHSADVIIAPNPFSEIVTVSGMESGSAVYVWSADGKLVYSAVATGRTAVIPADLWAAGAYYVRVMAANGSQIAAKQIVKK